ncbi:TPA: restriction endonuclease subunit S [Streptococcus suis]
MSKIEEMIAELCPNGVEWKELGEVLDYEQPTKYIVNSKDYNEEYPIPVLTAGQTFILGYTNETEGVYAASKEKPIIIFDDFTTASKWVDFEFKVKSSAVKILTIQNEQVSKVLIRYVWHYLGTITYKPAQHGRQWIGTYSKIKIPIPPLKIQKEIVALLDKFTEYVTELTAELTAELTLRQKQYNYFRDYLLNFDSDSSGGANNKVYQVEWKTLGEVAENLDYLRKPVTKGSRSSGRYPYYGASGIIDYVDDYIFDGDYLLVSEDGANLIARKTPIAFSVTGKSWINNHAHVLKFESDIDRKYVSYYLNHIDLTPYISGAAQPKLNQQNLNSIKLAYPKQEVRNRIVQVLDNFDVVCNDLNIGLPKEIELRQKQYDYFREKLLTFTAEGVYTDSTVQYSTVQYSTVQTRPD